MLCFLIAIICLSGNKSLVWRLFIPYLFFICNSEFAGIYLKSIHHPNQWPYNVLLPLQIVFNNLLFINIYRQYLKNTNIIYIGMLMLFIIYIYDIFSHGFLLFNSNTYNVMSVIFVVYSMYYFYIILTDNRYLNLKSSANFWWVCGILFFYFGSTVVNLFRGRLKIQLSSGHYLTYYIYGILNIIMYGFWCYTFICKRWSTTLLD